MVAIPATKKRILVTSALPYVNAVPHLGTLIGCVLSADVFARFQRSAGREVLYICGTDEHGTTTTVKAKEEGLTPQQICDKYYKLHKDVYEWFGCSFDHFGRTSLKNHVTRTQEIYATLKDAGYILEKDVKQLYSEESKTFLADRYVEGTCPHCSFARARGDQCDACGKLLTPLELIDPVSKIDGAVPVVKESTHLFLDLAQLQEELVVWSQTQSALGFWADNAIRTTNAWFKQGLEPRAITRDLDWGVPVPGYKGKVFYVWFEAPIGYISDTEQLLGEKDRGGWRSWWQNPDNVELYQFMAKDNIPFHTIMFPASLLGSGGTWTMLHHINSTEYLNYEDAKFSKSNGTGVFGDDAIKTGIPADVWRYYLLINRPETADTVFHWSDFQEKLNNELVANIGNLVNRTITFIARHCAGTVKAHAIPEHHEVFWERIQEQEQIVTDLLVQVKLKEALKQVMHISKLGNQFFQEEAPWKSIKESPEAAEQSLALLANLVKDLAIMLEPFLPNTTASIFSQLALEPTTWEDLGVRSIGNHAIGEPQLLFTKIDDKTIEKLRKEFSGKNGASRRETGLSPTKIDFRVAKITKVTEHPKAEKLYIEEIDLGPEGSRTIVSGLKGHYTPEELVGKQIIVVANLLPAKLRGVLSEGMLLAAEKDDTVEVLFVDDAQATPGDRLVIEGRENEKPQSKITIDEFFSLKYQVANNEAHVEGRRLLTPSKQPVTTKLPVGKIT